MLTLSACISQYLETVQYERKLSPDTLKAYRVPVQQYPSAPPDGPANMHHMRTSANLELPVLGLPSEAAAALECGCVISEMDFPVSCHQTPVHDKMPGRLPVYA